MSMTILLMFIGNTGVTRRTVNNLPFPNRYPQVARPKDRTYTNHTLILTQVSPKNQVPAQKKDAGRQEGTAPEFGVRKVTLHSSPRSSFEGRRSMR